MNNPKVLVVDRYFPSTKMCPICGAIKDDMERMDGRKRDVRKVRSLITSLWRAESTMMSKTAIKKDIEEYAEDYNQFSDVSMSLISDYMDCFTRLFLIEDQPAFEQKLRSSIKSLKSAKHHFSDPSLAVAALKATPDMLMKDLNTLGYLFESLCIRDLRIYADSYDGQIYHYHDEKGNEVDAVVELPDGRWGMIEIKIRFNQVESAACSLVSLRDKFIAETGKTPAFLCVICGLCKAAYQRSDGVFVVPITALAP